MTILMVSYQWRSMVPAFLLLFITTIALNGHVAWSYVPSTLRPAFTARDTPCPILAFRRASSLDDDDLEEEEEMDPVALPLGMEDSLTETDLQGLTVPELKQQLRLRGLKVGGRKRELIDRLLGSSAMPGSSFDDEMEDSGSRERDQSRQATEFAENRGKELVDVTEYLEAEDLGKNVKTWSKKSVIDAEIEDDDKESSEESTNDNKDEVWGSEARIVDDYEGRRLVVDSLSQLVVEFKGSNQSYVSALVVASRDALRPFLAGGESAAKNQTAAEQRVREIQMKREQANRMPVRFEDDMGLDEGDETGLYSNVLSRDYSDWGKYTVTGAQLSAQEVQGVLLLSDVYGAFAPDTQALAEKIAFECQPVVVMVPDLFRGYPWKEDRSTPGKNERGQTYEEWRACHSDLRVSTDIRAAAACLRERYGVSSVVVWGTCYGGGRALEAAAGYIPGDTVHDVDGSVGPPLVNPMAVVAWYPTRYNASALFGKDRIVGTTRGADEETPQLAVMGVFAGKDDIPGARPEDAANLKSLLEEDERVKDSLVKVFPERDHGFAHIGLAANSNADPDTAFERFVDDEFGGAGQVSLDDGEADVACLLSTAFMETYSRVFLPTTGTPISKDGVQWSADLEMKNLNDANTRDIRQEIEESLDTFVEEPLGGYRIDPSDASQTKEMENLLRSMQKKMDPGPYKIMEDDDLDTMYAKMKAIDDDFELF